MHLMRLIPRRFTFAKRREIRSCTEVRILPLHFPVAKEFIRLICAPCGTQIERSLYLSARASLFAPLVINLAGITCYLSDS